MLNRAIGQIGNILSGKPKNLTKTSTVTGGSLAGQEAGQYGLDQYKNLIEAGPTAYTGMIPGTQGPNIAQQQQFDLLTGMRNQYGAPAGYQQMYQNMSQMGPQQLGPMDRSAGPGAYSSNMSDALRTSAKKDYTDALKMMQNQIGVGAGNVNAFGSSRQGVAEGVGGARAADDYLARLGNIDQSAYDRGMQYMGQDLDRNINIAQANNQSNLGFGNMRMAAARNDLANQQNLVNLFGGYGQNLQDQQNIGNQFAYNDFLRQQNYKPNMLNAYMGAVSQTPFQQTQTNTAFGQGKSDLNNLIGMGIGLAGAAGGMGWKPFKE